MFYDTLLELCKQNHVKVTNVVKELNMSSGNLARWKSGVVPRGKNLRMLADYFHVSTDYLLGNKKGNYAREIGENTVIYRKKDDITEEHYTDEQMDYVVKVLIAIKNGEE